MKKNQYLIILIFLFVLSTIFPIPGYAQSLIQEDSISPLGVDGVLVAKAKKKKKKKKKKSSKSKSKSKKGSTDEFVDSSDSSTVKKTATKNKDFFVGIMGGYIAKGVDVSNIYADVKIGIWRFYPYVDFMYTMGVTAFSLMHIGGGIMYSIPLGMINILAGVGAQYGMWSRSNEEYKKNDEVDNFEQIFGPDSGITSDDEVPDSAAFIYVVPRVEVVVRLTDMFAITAEVGGLIAVSEGVPLSDESKKFAGTNFLIGAGAMLTF